MSLLLLLIFAVLTATFLIRRYLRTAAPAQAARLRRSLFWIGALLLLVLAARGYLVLLIPLLGALLAFLLRALPILAQVLVQYLPLWRRWQQQRAQYGAPGGGAADQSRVETRFLRMQLDHDSGAISGEVLQGRHAGRDLADLAPEQLMEVYEECARSDRDSVTLLRAYLERVYGNTWEEWRTTRPGTAAGGAMSSGEAYEILGLAPGASRADIIGAHRRLMQKLHPDRGGSDYLAAKINQAKDVLLD